MFESSIPLSRGRPGGAAVSACRLCRARCSYSACGWLHCRDNRSCWVGEKLRYTVPHTHSPWSLGQVSNSDCAQSNGKHVQTHKSILMQSCSHQSKLIMRKVIRSEWHQHHRERTASRTGWFHTMYSRVEVQILNCRIMILKKYIYIYSTSGTLFPQLHRLKKGIN